MQALLIVYLVVFTLIAVFFLKKFWGYAYGYFFWGGINVPSKPEKVEKMVKILAVQPGDKVADLGSGSGRLLVALAKAGAMAHGYEINPFLVAQSRKLAKEAGLEDKIFVYRKNLWKQNLSGFDAIVIYQMAHTLKYLEKKFERELKPGAKVVSNYFKLPTWRPVKSESNIYLYIKGKS